MDKTRRADLPTGTLSVSPFSIDIPEEAFGGIKYLEKFTQLVEKGKTVLDVGCGDGKPIDEYLVKHGFAVNGIDILEQMILLAKRNVPEAFYEVRDVTKLKDGEYCVNGIVSFYALFSIPKEQYSKIFKNFASFMPNEGALLIAMGLAKENKDLVEEACFKILLNEIVGFKNEKHQFILAHL